MCVGAAQDFLPWIGILCAIVEVLLATHIVRRRSVRSRGGLRLHSRWLLTLCVLSVVMFTMWTPSAGAATTPQTLAYNGHLLDAAGNAVTTAQTIRFSLWNSADLAAGEVTATGAILTSSAAYAGWKDAFTVTPDARGYFSVTLGSSVALPDFSTLPTATLLSLFLQVEVKPDASAATAYEVLDPDAADAAVDRSAMLSVPFALNADLLDQHHAGTSSGSIPVLGSGGLLPPARAPAGTDRPNFILDQDASAAAGSLSLQFGGTIAKNLSYDIDNARFNFDDDLRVQGDLTVTGLINGVDITQRSLVKVYEPQYEGAAYAGDGTNNVGQLSVSHSGSTLRNFYQWTSSRGTLQDYEIMLRVPLSADFEGWGSALPLSIVFRTRDGDAAANALGFRVFDTAGTEVTLTGSGTTGLQSTDWATASFGFAGNPTWTAGGEMLIKLALSARNSSFVQVGPLTVRSSELLSE